MNWCHMSTNVNTSSKPPHIAAPQHEGFPTARTRASHQCALAADPAQDLLACSKLGLALQIGDGYSEGNARAHVHAGMYSGTAVPGAMIKRTDMKLISYFAFAPYPRSPHTQTIQIDT
jgi:hypothetical protein